MDHPLAMNVDQPTGDVFQLDYQSVNGLKARRGTLNGKLTSSNRFAPGWSFTKSLMFPFTIQSDTIANWFSDIVTPINGRMFGCRRAFHVTTSLQNLCAMYYQCTITWGAGKISDSR